MAKKWLLREKDGRMDFIMGNVRYHSEFVDNDPTVVKGGGYWHIEKENKVLYLYGSSLDYGYASKEDIIRGFSEGYISESLTGFMVVFSKWHDLRDILNVKVESEMLIKEVKDED